MFTERRQSLLLRVTLACVVCSIAQGVYACDMPPLLKKDVQSLANLLSDGNATLSGNSVECLKIDKPADRRGVPGYAVLFTMFGWRGSNAVTEYLAYFDAINHNIFNKQPMKYAFVDIAIVGGGGWRQVHLAAIQKNKIIVLKGKEYRQADPYCCPTIPIEIRYELQNGRLAESG